MKTAQEIMTTPVESLFPEATLVDAAKKLAALNIGSLPVIYEGELVGIITDRDIVVSGLAKDKPLTTRVDEIATGRLVTVAPDDPIADVAAKMAAHQVRRAPVVDGGSVVGMISQADVALALGGDDAVSSMVKDISKK